MSEHGPRRAAFARLANDRGAIAGIVVICVFSLIALAAPVVAPYSPSAQPDIVALRSLPPSFAHPFGTDPFSRDVLSRVIFGARVSLGVAFLATAVAMIAGTLYGAVAGYFGGALDTLLMRLDDAFLAIPRVLLLIAIAALWGHLSVLALVLVLGFTGWFGLARLVRAEVMRVSHSEYVVGARALGASHARLLFRHVLPQSASSVIVAATLGVGNVIILEAGLSYLGLGVQQPQASWGNIIQDGSDQLLGLWWLSFFPGLAIVLTVLAFTALGDGLRDALDPRTDSHLLARSERLGGLERLEQSAVDV